MSRAPGTWLCSAFAWLDFLYWESDTLLLSVEQWTPFAELAAVAFLSVFQFYDSPISIKLAALSWHPERFGVCQP